MKSAIAALGVLVLICLFAVNALGGVVSGVWLVVLGDWRTVFWALRWASECHLCG